MTRMLAPEMDPVTCEFEPVLTPVPSEAPDTDLSVDDLGSRIVGMAGRLAAATARWLLLVAEFDRRNGAATMGLASTARWLSFACGLSHRTAVEHVRVARALTVFPQLVAAMASGSLSYSHARAITRLARTGESGLVDDLVALARHATIGQLEDTVRGLRTVEDDAAPADAKAELPEPYLSHSWTGQSQWRAHARLDPQHGALVQSVLETIGRREKIAPAQALVRMAEIALVAINDSGTAPRPLRGDEHAAIVIHVDAALIPPELSGDHSGNPRTGSRIDGPTGEPCDAVVAPPCDAVVVPVRTPVVAPPTEPVVAPSSETSSGLSPEPTGAPPTRQPSGAVGDAARSIERGRPAGRIARGPGLPIAVVLHMLCIGRMRTAVRDRRGGVRDLGRSKRVVSTKLFRALLMRDGCCTHPGCGSRAKLEAHHVVHWLYGGRTDLENMVLLCGRHHHAHHHGEFSIVIQPDKSFAFLRPDGRLLERIIDPARLRDTDILIEHEHTSVPTDAARGLWTGERRDRDYAVSVLADRRERRAREAGAPGSGEAARTG